MRQRSWCRPAAGALGPIGLQRRGRYTDPITRRWVAMAHLLSRLIIADKPMIRSLLFASCLLVATSGAIAQESPAAVVGNAAAGKQLTYTCQGCHGIPGYKNAYPNYHVPRIGGQAAPYLVNALNEYQQGNRKHPTMQAQAESFSAQDIADIAAYLSSLK